MNIVGTVHGALIRRVGTLKRWKKSEATAIRSGAVDGNREILVGSAIAVCTLSRCHHEEDGKANWTVDRILECVVCVHLCSIVRNYILSFVALQVRVSESHDPER